MDTLRAELDKLVDNRLSYVMARSTVNNDAQGYKEAGIARATFYSWPVEERDALNALAQRIKRETIERAIMNLQDNAFEASEVLIKLMKARDDRVKLSASTQVLDRTAGKPKESVKVENTGDITLRVVYDKK
jgi:hypothetical protein